MDDQGQGRRGAGEAGFSLVEVLTVISLLSVVLAMTVAVMWSVQGGIAKATDRSRSNDAVRRAVQELDRQVRSGNVLYDPAAENDPANGIHPGLSVRVYTQANATTNTVANRCVQWRIHERRLQSRWWSPTWQFDGAVSGWRTLATGIVNDTTTPAFSIDPRPEFGRRIMVVSLIARTNSRSGQPVRLEASVTGRNTEYGFLGTVCNPVPPYPSS